MRSSAASAVVIFAIDAGRNGVWMFLPLSTRPVSASTRIQATGSGVVGNGGRLAAAVVEVVAPPEVVLVAPEPVVPEPAVDVLVAAAAAALAWAPASGTAHIVTVTASANR